MMKKNKMEKENKKKLFLHVAFNGTKVLKWVSLNVQRHQMPRFLRDLPVI